MTRKYSKVLNEDRRRLIQKVKTESLTIKQAAQELDISYENAKAIYRVYKHECRFYKRKTRQRNKQDKHQNELIDRHNNKDPADLQKPAAPLAPRDKEPFFSSQRLLTPQKRNITAPIKTNFLRPILSNTQLDVFPPKQDRGLQSNVKMATAEDKQFPDP